MKEDVFMTDWIQEVWDKGFPQVQKELFDYWNLMDVHAKLLMRVTNGKMSKPNYTWDAIKDVLERQDDALHESKDDNNVLDEVKK